MCWQLIQVTNLAGQIITKPDAQLSGFEEETDQADAYNNNQQ